MFNRVKIVLLLWHKKIFSTNNLELSTNEITDTLLLLGVFYCCLKMKAFW